MTTSISASLSFSVSSTFYSFFLLLKITSRNNNGLLFPFFLENFLDFKQNRVSAGRTPPSPSSIPDAATISNVPLLSFIFPETKHHFCRTSLLNWITSILSALLIVFIVIVGFIHGKASNLTSFFPYETKGVFNATTVVYWSYIGFDIVATTAEETKKPSRDIQIVLIGSMHVITVVYCLMVVALTMMANYNYLESPIFSYRTSSVDVSDKFR